MPIHFQTFNAGQDAGPQFVSRLGAHLFARQTRAWPMRAGILSAMVVLLVPAAGLAVAFVAVLLGAALVGVVVWAACGVLQRAVLGVQSLLARTPRNITAPPTTDGRVNVRVIHRP